MTPNTAAIENISLDDKYAKDDGRIYLTGSQAFVRLLLVQQRRDRVAGLNTAGFISGYRGSPMTAIDEQLWRAKDHLENHNIKFWPGINEDLAATAVWGTQQVHYWQDNQVDGVYSMWYAKGPGVDRSVDAIRQGHWHGAAKNGGVLILAGDDPQITSTISNWHSELLFEDMLMPVLYPSDIQEVFDLGLYGLAMSRFSGNWIGYKCLPETIETGASINASHDRLDIVYPEFDFPADGVNSRANDSVYVQEARIRGYRLPAAVAFARANNINFVSHPAPKPRFGIVAMGRQWRDTLQALYDLGLDDAKLAALGITILKVRMPFPVDRETYREFAEGLEEVLVIEDKREQLENALRNVCYDLPTDRRPRVVGRVDENGAALVSPIGKMNADTIAPIIAQRIAYFHSNERSQARLAFLQNQGGKVISMGLPEQTRLPYFCSGCPHNTSTKVPEGSIALGGVGCHYMATWMDRDVHTFCQMGGEGVSWVGIEPYVKRDHIFSNLGDGTYYHSGILAVRASVAAGTNITYKLLFNDAVAMTGGQPVDGPISPQRVSHQVRAEGVERIAVVVDEKEELGDLKGFAEGTTLHPREDLNAVQEELRQIKGVSFLIYVQTCASEKRRRRKRGKFPDPAKRLFINDRVCEGCGDCGVQSNCTAIQPLETDYGRKRKVDQSMCNKDYACNNGFCPSFVTVLGGKVRKAKGVDFVPASMKNLPDPKLPEIYQGDTYGMLIVGVGGTGVATIGALLSMAGHIDQLGASLVDQLGFAQKGGPVISHLRLANTPEDINTPRVNLGMADVVLAADLLTANMPDALAAMNPEKTKVILNTQETFTGEFTRNPDLEFPADNMIARLHEVVGKDNCEMFDAYQLALRLLGDTVGGNLFMVGYAWQKGLIPLSEEALLRAIELNGVAVDWNKEAFLWGRRAAYDFAAVEAVIEQSLAKPVTVIDTSVEGLIERRVADLTAYQNADYAARYRRLAESALAAEKQLTGRAGFAEAVAKYAYKLMAYKDEYEVARLYADPAFKQKLEEQFEGDYKLEFNLAPPLLARKDKKAGIPRKLQFGPWMIKAFGLLQHLKGLRGTPLDVFGYTAERKMERALIGEYELMVKELVKGLNRENHGLAVKMTRLPEGIRGYGHVKERHVKQVDLQRKRLLAQWRGEKVAAETDAVVQYQSA